MLLSYYFSCHSCQRGPCFITNSLLQSHLPLLLMSGESLSSVHASLFRFTPLYLTTYQASTSGQISKMALTKSYTSSPPSPLHLLLLCFFFSWDREIGIIHFITHIRSSVVKVFPMSKLVSDSC